MANWCDLPFELLDLIAQNFDLPSDTLHFRSVCGSWRWAVSGPTSDYIPLSVSPLKLCKFELAKRTFFHLSDGMSRGWLIKTEEKNPGFFHLFNPFLASSININQPHIQNSNLTLLNISNVQIRELGHEFALRSTCSCDHGHVHDSCNMENEKVAFKLLSSSNSIKNYVILATHNTGKLLFYHSFTQEWVFLDDLTLGYDERSIYVNDWSLHYVDVVEYKGTFYAITNSGRTVAIEFNEDQRANNINEDLSSFVSTTLLTKSIIGGDKKCLVKSGDELLMVDLYTCPTPSGLVKVHAVEIYKLDKEDRRWVLVKDLENRTIFLSNHSSFSVSGSLPGCVGNSVYFHLKNNWDYNKEDQTREDNKADDYFKIKEDEIGVFDYDKGTIGSLDEYLEDSEVFSCMPPDWVNLVKV